MTLTPVAQGVYAHLQEPAGPGRPNAGVVVETDGLTLIDSLMTPRQAEQLEAELAELGLPVRRVVLTTSHIEHTGGTSRFRLAAIYGSRQVSARMDQPPNITGYQRLFADHAAEFAEITTRPVTHLVAQPAFLSQAVVAVPMAGQISENLVVQVPSANVVFAGALCSFGVTPLAFDGDPAAWADQLDALLELGRVIVPGHGPVGGEAELREQQAYLRACVAARGEPTALASGPWDAWPGAEYHAVNVERAAMVGAGDDRPPPTMLRLLGMA